MGSHLRVGDRVCVSWFDKSQPQLEFDHEFIIADVEPNERMVKLEGVDGWWGDFRFSKVR
jgi:hypothetical protein